MLCLPGTSVLYHWSCSFGQRYSDTDKLSSPVGSGKMVQSNQTLTLVFSNRLDSLNNINLSVVCALPCQKLQAIQVSTTSPRNQHTTDEDIPLMKRQQPRNVWYFILYFAQSYNFTNYYYLPSAQHSLNNIMLCITLETKSSSRTSTSVSGEDTQISCNKCSSSERNTWLGISVSASS